VAARVHLARLAPFYGLGRGDVESATLRHVHDTGRGGIIATYVQQIDGVEVFGEEVKLLLGRDRGLLAASGSIPGRGRGVATPFRLDAGEAVARALADFAGVPTAAVRARGALPGGFEAFEPAAADLELSAPIRARRVLFHLPGGLEPAYSVEIAGATDARLYVISAVDGALLFRHGLIQDAAYSYRAWTDPGAPFMPLDGPQGSAPSPHPTGTTAPYMPALTAPGLVSLQNGPISTNDPWLPPGATVTTGNNVDAYADLVAPDGFSASDLRASTSSPGAFDYTYDTSLAPNVSTNQRMASITQLFYTTNFLHDWYYDAGFDEAAGNAQLANFGRGGVEGDRMRAEAQDYGGTGNANMFTPQDGGTPRMQMYVFPVAASAQMSVSSASLNGNLAVGTAAFGPQAFSVSAQVVVLQDAVAPTSDGCSAATNAPALAGRIALVDRAGCAFTVAVQNAQNAGAVGVIVANNVAGAPPAMGGTSGTITIGALSISQADGAAIKTALAGGSVTVTMTRSANVTRDGTIDNQIVAHEYGHYVSNRLIGNSSGLNNQQGVGMGEGWGDFHALLLTVRPEDALVAPGDFSGVYPMGAYALSPSSVAGTAYYFGFRRYPYSTDLNKDPLTFRHIQDGEPLPVGPPMKVINHPNSEVHRTGEIWCTMLWECYAALLRDTGRLTFAQAQARMRDYLVAAYKLTPSSPTFTEARDALLAVAMAADPADHALFCAAFARRGIGHGAISPPRFAADNVGVVESYECGGELQFVSASLTDDLRSCDDDGFVDEGESGTLAITLRNTGGTSLNGTTVSVTSTNPAVSFPGGNVAVMSSSAPFTQSTGSLVVDVEGATGVQTLDFAIAISDPGLVGAAVPGTYVTSGNVETVATSTETVDSPSHNWTFEGNPLIAANAWRRETVGVEHRFHAPDGAGISDQFLVSPPMSVAASGTFSFTFRHAYAFETDGGVHYDGGVLEITENGGATWTDIGSSASPGYGGTIFTGAGNPLAGRSAFVATSPSWPALIPVTVNLGTAYAGKTVQIRFRLGTDPAATDDGWHVDDIAVANLTSPPFLALVADSTECALVAAGDAPPATLSFAVAGSNPVARGTPRLRFALPRGGHVTIGLYDVAGRRVAVLAEGEFPAGVHTTGSARGPAVRAGVYFARLEALGHQLVQRIVVLR
jgi:hypothetical protein